MYQTMSYEDQLHMKETQIRELLEEALIQGGQIDENGNAAFEWEGIQDIIRTSFLMQAKGQWSVFDLISKRKLHLIAVCLRSWARLDR